MNHVTASSIEGYNRLSAAFARENGIQAQYGTQTLSATAATGPIAPLKNLYGGAIPPVALIRTGMKFP